MDVEIGGIIAIILWAITSLVLMCQYAPFCKDLSFGNLIVVGLIFIIGGPFFAFVNILEVILGCILPEGWDSDGPQ
jgi:4-hydroxybenzoate polyprenyltransferase